MARAPYDPVARRERYLRTRQLKGRQSGSTSDSSNQLNSARQRGSSGERSAQQTAQARLEALQGRLDRLRDLLAQRVAAAQKRSGIEPASEKRKTSTSKDTGGSKKGEPRTAEEKRKDRERSAEYRKQHKNDQPTPVQKQIEQAQAEIRDIRKKLKDAVESARRSDQSQQRTDS